MDAERPAPRPPSLAPEHDWAAAAGLVYPTLRPHGTSGVDGHRRELPTGTGCEPILSQGPASLVTAYVLPASGFDVLVSVEHLLSWGVGPEQVHDAAMTNLSAWSAGAPWTEEVEGDRRVIWSDTGDGWDASRILLPEVRRQLSADLSPLGRILVGVPERHLLIAASLAPDDVDFAQMFADYVAERHDASDEPIHRGLFELADEDFVEFGPLVTA